MYVENITLRAGVNYTIKRHATDKGGISVNNDNDDACTRCK